MQKLDDGMTVKSCSRFQIDSCSAPAKAFEYRNLMKAHAIYRLHLLNYQLPSF